MLRTARLDGTHEVIAWDDIGAPARADLARSEDRWFPEELSPFAHEPDRDPRISLALRCGDRIVGWALICRLDASCVDYANIYVQADHNLMRNGSFAPLVLFAEAIQRQRATDGEGATLRFDASEANRGLLLVIANHFRPYLIDAVENGRAYKILC